MTPLFDSVLVTIGGAMLGSFWWIAALATALALLLPLLRGAAPERRHAAAALALLAVPIVFARALEFGAPADRVTLLPGAVWQALPETAGLAAFDETDWARPAAILWLCGVALLSLRTFGGWVYLRLLIRRAKPFEWPGFATLCERAGWRGGVELRASPRADSPFTAGWRRPAIIVPLATIAGLPAEQFEAIVLHELAHIRRGDYVTEWALHAMETMFFYHPAVWWMTAVLRREREQCCDDMAIAAGAERAGYAKALLRLEEMRVPALANGGAGSSLRERVARILGYAPSPSPWPAVLILTLTAAASLAPLAFAQQTNPYQKWADQDVTYIIQPEERRAYESLRDNPERERFIEQFWKRRDPTPGTEMNEAKEEHYRRIAYSNERFGEKGSGKSGWQTEKGRTYIVFGPPDEIESHPSVNFEQWFYKTISGVGNNVTFNFGLRPRR
ncbi:MAG: GWxTD domain-containing protein [Bryobacteraceae bacterium]